MCTHSFCVRTPRRVRSYNIRNGALMLADERTDVCIRSCIRVRRRSMCRQKTKSREKGPPQRRATYFIYVRVRRNRRGRSPRFIFR